jgi:hypothetical protein
VLGHGYHSTGVKAAPPAHDAGRGDATRRGRRAVAVGVGDQVALFTRSASAVSVCAALRERAGRY